MGSEQRGLCSATRVAFVGGSAAGVVAAWTTRRSSRLDGNRNACCRHGTRRCTRMSLSEDQDSRWKQRAAARSSARDVSDDTPFEDKHQKEHQDSDFWRRNLFGLRATGDGAMAVLLYDFLSSLADGAVTFSIDAFGMHNQNSLDFHMSGLELLIGAGLGVATVRNVLNTARRKINARQRERELQLGREAASIGKEWNSFLNSIDYVLDCANLLSVGRIAKKHEVVTEEDVDAALMWMETMDEHEGEMAINMLRKLEQSPIMSVRVRLARGLGLLGVRSNVIDATLARLRHDSNYQVRIVAEAALRSLHNNEDTQLQQQQQQQQQQQRQPAAETDTISPQLVNIQEVKNDGEEAAFVAMRGGSKASSPVDILDTLDVHTLCIVSALALGVELACVAGNQPIPFRFLGLGWTLAVAGLAVYPSSKQVWEKLIPAKRAVGKDSGDML